MYSLSVSLSLTLSHSLSLTLSLSLRFRRTAHVTPKSYLSYVNSYKSVYTQKRNEIGGLAERMSKGLTKLREASDSVEKLSVELEVKEKELAVASVKADQVWLERMLW